MGITQMCEYELASANAGTASLKKQSTNIWAGITCEGYPFNVEKTGFNDDADIWNLVKDNPGEQMKILLQRISQRKFIRLLKLFS